MFIRVTERTFYGVPTLSGLPIRKLFQDYKAVVEELFREERRNEIQRDLREMMRLVEPLETYFTALSHWSCPYQHHWCSQFYLYLSVVSTASSWMSFLNLINV